MKTRIAIISSFLYCTQLFAYGVNSHEELAKKSVPEAINQLQAFMRDRLFFNNNELYSYINEDGITHNINWAKLIYAGSRREDDIKPASVIDRPLNHFYNPLTNGIAWWADNATPDWAIGRNASGARLNLPYQKYSLTEANNYLYKALTTPNLEDRKMWRQQYFYSLGHVLHLLADMGQPANRITNPIQTTLVYDHA